VVQFEMGLPPVSSAKPKWSILIGIPIRIANIVECNGQIRVSPNPDRRLLGTAKLFNPIDALRFELHTTEKGNRLFDICFSHLFFHALVSTVAK
jgi:hypothetical protein